MSLYVTADHEPAAPQQIAVRPNRQALERLRFLRSPWGLDAQALPITALVGYKAAVARLVEFEIGLFRDTVLAATPAGDLGPTHAAVALSEAFVLHMRRRLLLPALAAAGPTKEAK